jgi:hypothetical protein
VVNVSSPDVSGVVFDKKDQVEQIVPWLVGGERLSGVFDLKGSGTGFIAITNKRLMFYDKAFLGKRKALTSLPFNKLTSVSSIGEGRFLSIGHLVVRASSETYEFEFWRQDKAQLAYQMIMSEILQNEPA